MEKVIRLTENDLSKIVKRVISESVDYYDKIVSILEPPYFKNLISIGINENQYETILSKVFNQTVEKFPDSLHDENGNIIYIEKSDGDWYKYEYDNNDNETYSENSNGYWRKYEYDENRNVVYYEDSYGFIRGERNNGNLNESTDDRYYDKILKIIDKPYYQNLISMGIDEDHWGTIFSRLFNQPVRKYGVYFLDKNGNRIYGENSHGFWIKYEYNDNGNEIYREDSENGVVFDHRNNNLNESSDDRYYDKIVTILEPPYFQNLRSIGIDTHQWETILSKVFNKPVEKFHENLYDTNDNQIYYETSDGLWVKYEYDDNGNEIYYENNNGVVFDHRNNNLNESVDDKYYDKILNVLEPPYYQNLETIGIPEDHWNSIFSKLFNQPIRKDDEYLYDSNDNIIYLETSDGQWVKYEYDDNGNQIYNENSYGGWKKREYDSNGNVVYFENSDGVWIKKEYDDNGNQIYYENSDGEIRDKRNNGNLNESVDHYDKLLSILQPPYFKNLETMGIPVEQYYIIFERIFNQHIEFDIYGDWERVIYNGNGNEIYEESDGFWKILKYDEKGNLNYFENSDGYWRKQEYNENGKMIYKITSDGDWWKYEYDDKDNVIYYETSDGYWRKYEYDENRNVVYYEDSYGFIRGKRNNNNINESTEGQYYDKLLSILQPPYFQNLRSIGISEDHWDNILSKVYGYPVNVDYVYGYITNDSGNLIYYQEEPDGEWWKREYDDNENQIYHENSDGDWSRKEYDEYGYVIYYENSNGVWSKNEYGPNGNQTYYETSVDGVVFDHRNNGNINESIEDRYYDKLLSILQPPYFQNLISIGIPEDHWDNILSKVYGYPVNYGKINDEGTNFRIYSEINNGIYSEVIGGRWIKYGYDEYGNNNYYENSDGEWNKSEYDSNGNQTYYENSYGYWEKQEFNKDGYGVYFENSNGEIIDHRNNNLNESTEDIYYDKLLNIIERPYFRNLESMGISEDQYETIFSMLFGEPVLIDMDEDQRRGYWRKRIFNERDDIIYYEDSNGRIDYSEYDENGNEIYNENSDGDWSKYEYDSNGNIIYREDSDGFWSKYEYDENDNETYYENSSGVIRGKRNKNLNESTDYYGKLLNVLQPPYFSNLRTMGFGEDEIKDILEKIFDEELVIEDTSGTIWVSNLNDKEIYYEDKWRNDYWFIKQYNDNGKISNYNNSDGYWSKSEYDKNGNLIYREYSDGYWIKQEFNNNGLLTYLERSEGFREKYEYDENGNIIYYEDSNGEINIDNRNNN